MTEDQKRLDINGEIKTKYAIAYWLRDEQIKIAISRVKGRIEEYPHGQTRSLPVAVVGFGPSLKDTWEKIRDFKYIISCSGSHPFLIERGMIPTWHTAVDPLPGNTVKLIGQPHKDVQYTIASTCNPDVWDHLEGYKVQLFHIFDSKEEGIRALPHGEWALTGGCDVGLRSLTIARFLGFTNLHVFGLDGSSPTNTGGRHAGEHPNPLKAVQTVEYEGVTFNTTAGMLAAAKGLWHELDQMPDVNCKFYGDGLVQTMAAHYKPNPVPESRAIIGFYKPLLISPEYLRLNAQLHRDNLAYGVGGNRHTATVKKIMEGLDHPSVLDYGCGKSYLAKDLDQPIWEYDPAIPGKDQSPRPADLVVCTDVLEHIEEDKLLNVLQDLKRCIKNVAFFTINTGPAQKKLADGRNTHLIQKHKQWWKNRLAAYFTIGDIVEKGPELYIVVGIKEEKKKAA